MTTTDTEAFAAIVGHHRALAEGAAAKAGELAASVAQNGHYEAVLADLVSFLAEQVLPHASAEEQTFYQAAAAVDGLAATIEELIAEHRRLETLIETLAQAHSGQDALTSASTLSSAFAAHVQRENQVVLPRLQAEGTGLAGLLTKMHQLLEGAQPDGKPTPPAAGPEAELAALLLDAARALASSGEADRACRLVASAWAVLRGPRPDLAVKLTAALHGLAADVKAAPAHFSARPGRPEAVLDVRDMAPAKRHETIFATYGDLTPGASFVLVNDHDPKPLYYQFEAEHAGQFTWDYLEAGPAVWRVRVGRGAPRGAPETAAQAPTSREKALGQAKAAH